MRPARCRLLKYRTLAGRASHRLRPAASEHRVPDPRPQVLPPGTGHRAEPDDARPGALLQLIERGLASGPAHLVDLRRDEDDLERPRFAHRAPLREKLHELALFVLRT